MGWWGENATNLQDCGGRRLPSGATPAVTLHIDAYLSFRPNPVGVGQTILVNLWTIHGPSYVRFFTDYTVTFTKPDGTTDIVTMDSYRADSTAWFEYTVDQEGIWKVKFDVPGQYFPPGNYTMPAGTSMAGYTESYTKSCYYLPTSTAEQTLTVQHDQVASWPESPLPTDYWTRPIQAVNREWWTIGGDYPWRGPSGGSTWEELYPNTNTYWGGCQSFTPWVQGPNSAHVAWKKMGTISGILGGDQGYYSMTSGGGGPSIIYQGYAYQSVTGPGGQGIWRCYNIRTGETLWETQVAMTTIEVFAGFFISTALTPSYIEYSTGLPPIPGATASVGITPALLAISGDRLIKWDPPTGRVAVNVSIPTFATTEYYMNGYALSVQTVNTTGGPGEFGTSKAGIYRLINWTTFGSSADFSSRIVSNISWPMSTLGNFAAMRDYEYGIVYRVEEISWFDTPVTGFPWAYVFYDNATGMRYGTRIQAYSLKTGQMLWDKSFDNSIYHALSSAADHGKLALLMMNNGNVSDGGYYMCFEGATGNLLWKSEQMDSPWDIGGFGAYSIATAYGMIYRFAYSGVYAFDWNNGKIVWKYEAPAFSAYETPYTNANGTTMYSFNGGGLVADGKIYCYNTEHSPTEPITRGWGVHCINATTGKGIWTTKMVGSKGAVADGYVTVSGSDGYMYVYGKGQSATTVSAPQTAITQGQSVVLTGSVLDQSPAQPGTPCVSKDSMTTYMEYLHMQMPIDGLYHNVTVTGVPVSIDAVNPNGNLVHIADVTSDMSGTFSYTWKPTIVGDYAITATFMGDDSYGSSWAETHAAVIEAPTASPTPSSFAVDAINNTTFAVGVIAIIIALVIATVLILRKHP